MTDPRITDGCELLAAYEEKADMSASEFHPNWREAKSELRQFMLDNASFFLRDLPARVAELEEALRKARQIYWDDEADDIAHEMFHVCDAAINASLLSDSKAVDSTPTPPEASDDLVERVAKAISPYLMRSYSGNNPDVDDQASGRDTALHVAGLALSALRMPAPAVDEGKLREIRERHEREGSLFTTDGRQAHADRAALLAMLNGGRE